jgi:hypothetical protein
VLRERELAACHPALPPLLLAALSAATILGFRLRARSREGALLCTFAWMWIGATFLFPLYVATRHGRYAHREAVRHVMSLVGAERLVYLERDYARRVDEPDQKLLLLSRRVIPAVTSREIPALAADAGAVFLIATCHGTNETELAAAGLQRIVDFEDGRRPRALFANAAAQGELHADPGRNGAE